MFGFYLCNRSLFTNVLLYRSKTNFGPPKAHVFPYLHRITQLPQELLV